MWYVFSLLFAHFCFTLCSFNGFHLLSKSSKWFLALLLEIVATYFACNLTLQCKFSFLSELNVGDPSRNIIELIFQRASMDPSKSKPSWKIKRVLKVKNSIEVLKRFEDYREKVIKKANQKHKRHPRSTIDGNELLLFYGTTMACCRKPKPVPELCKDPSCRACRIIHSRFDMEFTRKNGVRLSTSSEEVCDNMVSFKLKKLKRAVIVCRVIAGSIGNTIDGACEDFDSIGRIGPHSNLEYLVVPNPSAILPCFLIVFNWIPNIFSLIQPLLCVWYLYLAHIFWDERRMLLSKHLESSDIDYYILCFQRKTYG